MSDRPCQLCGRENACLVVYVCWFNSVWRERVAREIFFTKKGMIVIDGEVPFSQCNMVNLKTGTTMRHDYKRPIPRWITDPLLLEIAAVGGEFPKSIKPSKRKKKKPMNVVYGPTP